MSTEQEHLRHYKMLLEAARRIGGVMNLDSLIDEILDLAQEVTRSEACSILLPVDDEGNLVLLSTSDRIRSLQTAPRVPAGQGIAGEVFRTREIINVRDASQDPRHYSRIEQEVGFITRAMLTIPLLEGTRCLGVMQALNPIGREVFGPDCEEIFVAFGVLVGTALLRLESQKQEVERARTQQELALARKIQESFQPPASQRFDSCRVHLRSFPARNVGGDFCFLHAPAPGRLLMGLGDVTGKGVPAALTMARATAMIGALANQLGDNLAEWVILLNSQICRELTFGRFIAITFLLADTGRSCLQICGAGQFPPLHLAAGQWAKKPLKSQPPLGILPGHRYHVETAPLVPGEMWLLYSDGITDARNPFGVELGEKWFVEALAADQSASKIFAGAVASWQHFIGPAAPHDDASLLLLDWRGLPPAARLEIVCCPETLCSGRRYVEAWAKYAGYDDVTAGHIVTACDEATSNVFRHGYRTQPGPVTLQVALAEDSLVIEISDQAEPISTDKIKGRDLADLRPGGLGTVILRKTFDSVCYDPQPNGNRLTLKKQLPD